MDEMQRPTEPVAETPVTETPAPQEPAPAAPVEPAPQAYAPEAAPAAYAPAPKKKSAGKIIAIVLAAAVVVAGLVVGGIFLFKGIKGSLDGSGTKTWEAKTPVEKVASGAKETVFSLVSEKTRDSMKKNSEAFSVNLSVEISKLMDTLKEIGLSSISIPINGSLELNGVWNESKLYTELAVLMGSSKLSVAELWASGDNAVLGGSMITGDKYYGIAFKDIAERLKKSIFAPGSGSEYEMPEDMFDLIIKALDGKEGEKLTEAASELIHELLEKLSEALDKHATIAEGKETVKIGEQDVQTNTVTITLDGNDLLAIAEDLYAWQKDSETVQSFLDTLSGLIPEETLDVRAELDEFMERIRTGSTEEDRAKAITTLKAYMDQDGKLVRAEGSEKEEREDGEPLEIRIILTVDSGDDGLHFLEAEVIEVSAELDEDDKVVDDTLTTSTHKIRFDVEKNDDNSFSGTFFLSTDGEVNMNGTVEWDKKGGDFTVKLSSETEYEYYENESYTISSSYELIGNLQYTDDTIVLAPEKLISSSKLDDREATSTEIPLDFVKLTLKKGASGYKDVPEFKDVIEMTEEEFTSLLDTFKSVLSTLGLISD